MSSSVSDSAGTLVAGETSVPGRHSGIRYGGSRWDGGIRWDGWVDVDRRVVVEQTG
jgi:hypothetical protein